MKPSLPTLAYLVLIAVAVGGGLVFVYTVRRARSGQPSSRIESSLTANDLFRRSRAQAAADPALLGIDFGDQVRVREAPETTAARVVGLEGSVLGFTRPSVTNVEVIGGAPHDLAFVVNLGDSYGHRWIRPDLLVLLHHKPGQVVSFEGSHVRWTRRQDGGWDRSDAD